MKSSGRLRGCGCEFNVDVRRSSDGAAPGAGRRRAADRGILEVTSPGRESDSVVARADLVARGHAVRVRWWVGMVVRFVCVIRVCPCPRVSR